MTHVPSDLKFSRDHEWVQSSGSGRARIGITDHAQKQLGDLVHVELPAMGSSWQTGENFSTVESVKSVSELYMPVAGTIVAVNESLTESLGAEQINDDPYGDGWIAEIRLANTTDMKSLLRPPSTKS